MADVNLNGLDEIYSSPTPEHKESSSPLNLKGLEDIYSSPTPSAGSKLDTLKDAVTGAGDTLGISQQVGGAAEGIPDYVQSLMHNLGLAGKSPSQVNAALASMGVKGDVGPTSYEQMYKQGTKDTLKDQEAALKRSPIAYRAGEAGGLGLGALATAGLAPELVATSKATPLVGKMAAGAVNAAPIGALYGGLNSSGSLIGGTPQEMGEVGKSTAVGAGIGAGLGAVAAPIGGALAKLGDIPAFKELAERYKIGQEGKSLGSETDQFGTSAKPESLDTALSQHDSRTATELLDGLNSMDDSLGKNVGKSLAEATEKGVNIKATPQMSDQLDKLMGSLPDVSVDSEGLNVGDSGEYSEPEFKNLSDYANKFKSEGLDPNEMWKFRNELANVAKTLKNSSNANDRLMANEIYSATSNLGTMLKQTVPEYGNAASRMEEFRRLMPETILSKDNPADVTGLRVSGTRNVDNKLQNNLKNLVRGLYTDNDTAKGSFTNLLKGMQELNDNELARKASGTIDKTIFEEHGVNPQQIEDYIKQQAMRSKVLQNYSGGPSIGMDNSLIGTAKNLVKNNAGYIAEKAGQANKNPLLGTSQKLFSAPDDALKGFSDNVLSKMPGQKPLADALNKAIDGKDQTAKNAVLFSIMQNPNLRTLVESNNLEF